MKPETEEWTALTRRVESIDLKASVKVLARRDGGEMEYIYATLGVLRSDDR